MFRRWIPYGLSLVPALAGALAAERLGLPIPWLLGSLLATAAVGLAGLPVRVPGFCRKAGLTVIGTSLGLYFTPEMVQLIGRNALLLLFGMAYAVMLGIMMSRLLYRFTDVGSETAWYASAMGGASEIAHMAEQRGADVAKVVSAHSLRVLMIVTAVPFFYHYMGYHDTDGGLLHHRSAVHTGGLLLLLAVCTAAARIFERFGWSNPWTFGPLAASALLAVAGIHLSAVPVELSHLGQLFIGWSLGKRFAPGFFRSAPRFLGMVAVCVGLSLILTALAAWLLAQVSGVGAPTIGLGLAPGGVAEMTITAKVLNLGVPLVTAFHVSRMIAVIGSADVLYRLVFRHAADKAEKGEAEP